jgi:hypothetical protein
MDLPITSRFFQKLSLYREARRSRRYSGSEWRNEEPILRWGADPNRHRDHATPLTVPAALNDQAISGGISEDISDKAQYIRNRFGNLVGRGLASWSDSSKGGILLTQDGLLMGMIINEWEERPLRVKWKYSFHYYLAWTLFYAGAIVLIAEASKALWALVSLVRDLATH